MSLLGKLFRTRPPLEQAQELILAGIPERAIIVLQHAAKQGQLDQEGYDLLRELGGEDQQEELARPTGKSHKIIPFESGHSRAQLVSIFLALIVVLGIAAVTSDYIQIQLINRIMRGEIITIAEATASDDRQAAIGIIYLVLFILTAILFCMWIHRAHRNLPSLGVTDLKYSPGWAVGGFFVPFLNLWRPYQVTKEIWKASDPSTDITDSSAWQSSATSPIIIFWWLMYIGSSFIGSFLFRSSIRTYFLRDDLEAEMLIDRLLTESWGDLVMDALEIPAAILLILVVRNIDFRQEKKSLRLNISPAL